MPFYDVSDGHKSNWKLLSQARIRFSNESKSGRSWKRGGRWQGGRKNCERETSHRRADTMEKSIREKLKRRNRRADQRIASRK